MEDIELVIKISKEDYQIMKHNVAANNPLCPLSQEEMVSKVANGIPLPKGHGDLIDRKKLQNNIDNKDLILPKDISKIQTLREWINNQNPIIEADKEN